MTFVRCFARAVFVVGVVISDSLLGPVAPAGAEDRSDLPLEKAIVGHWRTHSGRAEYYFTADGKILMVESDGKERQAQTYVVIGADEDEKVLRIKTTVVSTGRGHEKELRFATDAGSLMSTIRTVIDTDKIVVSTTWHYVDDAEAPPEERAE
jgi:hypothetical protein